MLIFSANYGEMDSLCEKTAGSKKFTFIGFAALLLLAAVLYAMYTGSVKGFIEVQNRQIS